MAEAQLHLVPFQGSWVPRVPNKIKMIGPHWTGSRAGTASGETFRFPWQCSIIARYGSTTVCQRVGMLWSGRSRGDRVLRKLLQWESRICHFFWHVWQQLKIHIETEWRDPYPSRYDGTMTSAKSERVEIRLSSSPTSYPGTPRNQDD